MRIIGFTGGIGSGKSTVLKALKDMYDADIIMADELGHLATEKGSKTYNCMVESFGERILNSEGEIDRESLAKVLFSDEKMLEKQNSIVHPFVKEKIREMLCESRKNGKSIAAVESAIMFESGCDKFCQEVWLVSAPSHIRIERLIRDRGYSYEKAEEFIKRQKSDDEYMKLCNKVIINDGDIENIYKQLRKYIE